MRGNRLNPSEIGVIENWMLLENGSADLFAIIRDDGKDDKVCV